jgi:glycerophosphoryl diester phosphodiesterase
MMDAWADHHPSRSLIGAHRGDSAHWPENSQAAFESAIAAGADFIETDVRLTRDGVPVACHDADFARLCGDARRVDEVTFLEAKALRPTLCTLAEVVGQVLPRALLLLDVKLTTAQDLNTLAACLDPIRAQGRIALGLRSLKAVYTMQGDLTAWPRLGLFADLADYAALAALGGTWARLWQADASADQIGQLGALGLNVVIMTGAPTAQSVGQIDPDTLDALLNTGPQAVMLNDPGLAVKTLRSARFFPTPDQEF